MRKLTILLIAVIFVASIFIVGVFGLKALPVEERYPVKDINFVDHVDEDGTVHYYEYGGKELRKSTSAENEYYVNLRFGTSNTVDIPIVYNLKPDNATNKAVDVMVLACSDDDCYTLTTSLTGAHFITLRLLPEADGASVTLLLKAADGSGVNVKLQIVVWK